MASFGDVIHGLKFEFSQTPCSMIDGHGYNQAALLEAVDYLAKLGAMRTPLDPLQALAAEILLARLPDSMTGRFERAAAVTG